MPARQRDRSQGHGGLVPRQLPPHRTQVLPTALHLLAARLERDDSSAAGHPDERGLGTVEHSRDLARTEASQDRGTRRGCHGLVQEDEAGGIDDDGISLASAHERDGGH